VQWNGAAYFGLTTRTILSNSDDYTITIRYDAFTQVMGVDLFAYLGYGDVATVEIFDRSSALVGSTTLTLPSDASPQFVGFEHDEGIGAVRLTSSVFRWSPILDNHSYGALACPGGRRRRRGLRRRGRLPGLGSRPSGEHRGCDTGVANPLFPDGCTLQDRLDVCGAGASNHGGYVSCVSHLTNELRKQGVLTTGEKGGIERCAAGSYLHPSAARRHPYEALRP